MPKQRISLQYQHTGYSKMRHGKYLVLILLVISSLGFGDDSHSHPKPHVENRDGQNDAGADNQSGHTVHVNTSYESGKYYNEVYLHDIFSKYGKNGQMSFEGFEHLLQNLGIGHVDISDHDIHDHHTENEFIEFHADHEHMNANQSVTEMHHQQLDTADHHRHAGTAMHNEQADTLAHHGEADTVVHHDQEEHHSHSAHEGKDGHAHRARRSDPQSHNKKCLSPREILLDYSLASQSFISEEDFRHLCPAIVLQIDEHACSLQEYAAHVLDMFHERRVEHCKQFHDDSHQHKGGESNSSVTMLGLTKFSNIPLEVWGYAIAAVTVISLVGLLAVALVPLMQKVFFTQLLQFLVALAIGSLIGDALLHLLPHALSPGGGHNSESEHSHGSSESKGHDPDGVYKGLTVLLGIYFFFIMERMLEFFTEWRNSRKKNKRRQEPMQYRYGNTYSAYNRTDRAYSTDIGRKLSRYSLDQDIPNSVPLHSLTQVAESDENVIFEKEDEEEIYRGEHDKTDHHGHSHSMGAEKQSVAAMAWMVIMGDGLHNFSDGLAIGAAFANSVSGGLSTSVAVFCHELPHELGDFAVLLKAGMSVRQALFYNIVSSVLCFTGLAVGVFLGTNIASASLWIFAVVGGMFIYIALVDMLPEITHTPASRSMSHFVLHMLGFSIGSGIMLVIALYEDQIVVDIGG